MDFGKSFIGFAGSWGGLGAGKLKSWNAEKLGSLQIVILFI
jgi:hypothetical protein